MFDIIEYSPELVGFDPALEELAPIHNMIGVIKRSSSFYSPLSKPYKTEGKPYARFEYMFKNKDLVSKNEETGVITLVDSLGREIYLEEHLGGWKFTQKSDFLKKRYAGKIKDAEELEAFATTSSYLRVAGDNELSSVLPWAYQEAESIVNNTWFNLQHWSNESSVKPKHEVRWELINGANSWHPAKDSEGEEINASTIYQNGSYSDIDLATSIEAIPSDKAAYLGDGVFTYDPEQKHSKIRLTIWFNKSDKKIFTINLI